VRGANRVACTTSKPLFYFRSTDRSLWITCEVSPAYRAPCNGTLGAKSERLRGGAVQGKCAMSTRLPDTERDARRWRRRSWARVEEQVNLSAGERFGDKWTVPFVTSGPALPTFPRFCAASAVTPPATGHFRNSMTRSRERPPTRQRTTGLRDQSRPSSTRA
jgi:hypothetical protein